VNRKRLLLGALLGFSVWAIWSGLLNLVALAPRYPVEQDAGHLLKHHSYAMYLLTWFLTLFLFSAIAAQLYVWVRESLGPGLRTALTVGPLVGFLAAIPIEVTTSRFPIDHTFTVCWIIDLVVGAILATLVAARVYEH
jgi:MFS family permease